MFLGVFLILPVSVPADFRLLLLFFCLFPLETSGYRKVPFSSIAFSSRLSNRCSPLLYSRPILPLAIAPLFQFRLLLCNCNAESGWSIPHLSVLFGCSLFYFYCVCLLDNSFFLTGPQPACLGQKTIVFSKGPMQFFCFQLLQMFCFWKNPPQSRSGITGFTPRKLRTSSASFVSISKRIALNT